MSDAEEAELTKNGSRIQLFLDVEDKTEDAKKSFIELNECTYSSKDIGSSGQDEHMTCDCHANWDPIKKINLACGEDSDCINRVTSVECVNKFGTCGKDCQNQRFQKKQYANISVFQTELKGFGVRTLSSISQGGFIYEYIGEVIDEGRFRKRMIEYDQKNFKHFYFMMLKNDSFIDATIKGSLARFCNHSCNPNAYVDKWVVGDKLRMGIFAKRDIQKGEEITFDYNVDRYGAEKQPCYCGEPNCIKFLGGKTQTDAALLLPDYISEALGITRKQEKQWLKENKHLRSKQQTDEAAINEEFVRSIVVNEITDTEVSKVMAALMKSQDLVITKKLIERIYLTNDEYINSSIIRMHGYKTLAQSLKDFKDQDDDLIIQILDILMKWPRVTRNKISSSQIEDVIVQLKDMTSNNIIKEKSGQLLNEWGKLLMAYRIPKNEGSKVSPDVYGRSNRSRSKSPSMEISVSSQTVEQNEDELPDGWNVAFDPNTGKNYYYHAELGISRWDRPQSEVPKGPKGVKTEDNSRRPEFNGVSRSHTEERMAKLEEEKLRKMKQEQFEEVRQKEKLLQDLIIQSQKEYEEKRLLEEKLRLEDIERQKEKYAKRNAKKHSKSSHTKATLEVKWTKLFASVVPNLLRKYDSEIGRDNLKGCARDLVKILVEKEIKKNSDSKPPDVLEGAKLKKVKEYSKTFMEKFLIKYRAKHNKKRSSENDRDVESIKKHKS